MNLTSKSRYALKIMMDLAGQPSHSIVKRGDIAQRQGVPAKYLDQIMRLLRKGGLVTSLRGRDGGYSLNLKPQDISVWDIFACVEDSLYPVLCVDHSQKHQCAYESACLTYTPWQQIYMTMQNSLAGMRLDQLVLQFGGIQNLQPAEGVRECPQSATLRRQPTSLAGRNLKNPAAIGQGANHDYGIN